MRFNAMALATLAFLLLIYDNRRMHDEVLDLRDELAAYGKCELMTSKSGDITVQHCIRTVAKN